MPKRVVERSNHQQVKWGRGDKKGIKGDKKGMFF